MKLKSIVLIMLSILVLSLVGCGTSSSAKNSAIEKEKVVGIVKNSFEKYFNEKLDTKEIMDSTKYINGNGYWITVLKDDESHIEYYASVSNDGKLDDIGYESTEESTSTLDEEEGKKISTEFIKKHFSNNEEEIKFIRVGSNGDFDFIYGKDEQTQGDKAIYITIDSETKNVCGFVLAVENKK